MTLTRKEQVIQVLQAGGTLQRPHHARALLVLRDCNGQEIAAWQQAMQAAARQFPCARRDQESSQCA